MAARLPVQIGEPDLFESGALVAERRMAVELRVRRAAPQPQGFGEPGVRGARIVLLQQSPSVGDQTLEAAGVDLFGIELEDVTGRPMTQHRKPARSRRCVQGPAQMRDMTLECCDGVTGRSVTPQFLDEQFGGHHAAKADEQQGEQCSPAWRAER